MRYVKPIAMRKGDLGRSPERSRAVFDLPAFEDSLIITKRRGLL